MAGKPHDARIDSEQLNLIKPFLTLCAAYPLNRQLGRRPFINLQVQVNEKGNFFILFDMCEKVGKIGTVDKSKFAVRRDGMSPVSPKYGEDSRGACKVTGFYLGRAGNLVQQEFLGELLTLTALSETNAS